MHFIECFFWFNDHCSTPLPAHLSLGRWCPAAQELTGVPFELPVRLITACKKKVAIHSRDPQPRSCPVDL